ncbi:MAG: Fis family transcriptional regulator, partial [Nitrospirales bacterium]|nr:Fis family transcriptional regulator [Nitrospirales bacterium]
VLITGYGDRDMETEALHVGAYAFLHKPVPPDVLLSPSDPFVIERDRLLKRVQEINRFIQKQLESSGNDTVH